jgi:toxin CptA
MTGLRIPVIPSMQLAVALVAVHLGAAALLWIVPLALPAQALLTLALAASLAYLLARDALLRAPRSIVALEIRDEAVSLQVRNGEWMEGEVLGSSYVSPLLTVVNFRPRERWRVRHLILVPDNAHPDDFRRLRIWLRWKRGEAEARASSEPG